ncbi:Wall-associated receptor kinase 2 [Bienertia sinuspersici]
MGYHAILLNVAALLLAILSLLSHRVLCRSSSASLIALPNCPEKCGDITVPYPFGIGDECHYGNPIDDVHYNFTCDTTRDPPALLFGPEIEVANISLANGELRAVHYVSYSCFDKGMSEANFILTVALERLTISSTQNSLVAIGCDTYGWFSGTGTTNGTVFNAGCMTVCNYAQKDLLHKKCSGIGCCLGFIPDGVNEISIEAKSYNDHLNVSNFNPCSVAFMVANDAMPAD